MLPKIPKYKTKIQQQKQKLTNGSQASPGKKRSRSISDEEGMAGVELLAQAIDSVIMRVQVRTLHIVDQICINRQRYQGLMSKDILVLSNGWSSGEVVKQHGEVGAHARLGAAWYCP